MSHLNPVHILSLTSFSICTSVKRGFSFVTFFTHKDNLKHITVYTQTHDLRRFDFTEEATYIGITCSKTLNTAWTWPNTNNSSFVGTPFVHSSSQPTKIKMLMSDIH
jgi:hypothetical protein